MKQLCKGDTKFSITNIFVKSLLRHDNLLPAEYYDKSLIQERVCTRMDMLQASRSHLESHT